MNNKLGPININRPCYAIETSDETDKVEITMYGEIVESQPIDWWTGEPVEGSFIRLDQFVQDLACLEHAKEIFIRLDSIGGDVHAALLIYNRLTEMTAKKTIQCDGVCMSAGVMLLCAADEAIAHATNIFMVHSAMSSLFGYYNKADLKKVCNLLDAADRSQLSAMKKKCGAKFSDQRYSNMLGAETYFTGTEALDYGFVDRLIDDDNPVQLSASADRNTIYVDGRAVRLPAGCKLPETFDIKTVDPAEKTAAVETHKHVEPGNNNAGKEGGKNIMAKNLEELRKENPELAAQVEADLKAETPESADAIADAQAEERRRIADIDAVAALFDPEAVKAAKYGDNPITAQELAYQQAKASAESGKAFASAAAEDYKESGAVGVTADPKSPDNISEPKTSGEKMAEARALVKPIFAKEDK